MKKAYRIFLICLVSLISSFTVEGSAYPSGGTYPPTFTKYGRYWYDSWNINRNLYSGEDGYLPNMLYETIDINSDLAFSWGLELKQRHSNRVELAQTILQFVQQWTIYGYDEDNVFMDGKAQVEWAWNGDEMAHMVQNAIDNTGAVISDCEDVAFFCATLFYGAGFDVAIVDAPSHCALLIWFPDYPNANSYWNIQDGREYGWIWIEATGKQNPVGWTPPSFSDGDFTAYPITHEIDTVFFVEEIFYSPLEPTSMETVQVNAKVKVFTSQIKNINIIYSVNGGTQQRVTMTLDDLSLYVGSIPGQEEGSDVDFFIQILGIDNELVNSGSFFYEVKDSIFGVEPILFYLVGGIFLVIVLLGIFS
jgi:hypothetical protein